MSQNVIIIWCFGLNITNHYTYLPPLITETNPACQSIDDYAKNGGPGRSDFYVVYHESLRTWIKAIVNKFAISNYTALLLSVHALGSYLKLIVNLSFIAYQIKKFVEQRIMVKSTSRSDRPWSAIFCVIVYFPFYR